MRRNELELIGGIIGRQLACYIRTDCVSCHSGIVKSDGVHLVRGEFSQNVVDEQ